MAKTDELRQELEEHDVPKETIDRIVGELDASPLRKRIGEYERRWKEEAEPAISYKQRHETQPKREEALKGVGVDYSQLPKFGQEVLDSIPADKLEDKEFLAQFVTEKGFQATPQTPDQQQAPAAQQIVNQAMNAPVGAVNTAQTEAEFHAALDAVPDGDLQATKEVLARYGRLAKDEPVAVTT